MSAELLRDTYNYVDGGGWNARPGKALRLVVYTVGEVFTIFLTQLLWMPLEVALRGPRYSAIVDYRRDVAATGLPTTSGNSRFTTDSPGALRSLLGSQSDTGEVR